KNSDAIEKSKALVDAILSKMAGLNKPRCEFIMHIFLLFSGLRGRYNFMNMSRYGTYGEQTYRNQFNKDFDFLGFNFELVNASCSKHRIIAFDPSYLPKSGKSTDNLGYFWSGCAGKSLKGLEIGGIAIVDIENNTSMNLEAVPTPNAKQMKQQGKTLIDHYAAVIIERKHTLIELSSYLAVDGYFAKLNFINPVINQTNLHVVCKLRQDANLRYLYEGEKSNGKGRPKEYDGKIDVKHIDAKKMSLAGIDGDTHVYTAIVNSVMLKKNIRIAYLMQVDKNQKPTGRYIILFSTDTKLNAMLIYAYYKARFQIEFLFRDAKQHCGLTHCQARSEAKMHFHCNASLTTVSIAKAVSYLDQNKQYRNGFSMADVKTLNLNKLMADRIFCNLDIDLNDEKIKHIYTQALILGQIAA
ncbi:MAG: transposase, partial [Gammaproteobacteria bacterium]|nr:transposase [Gammaproteobacteria bacterium]